MQWWMALLNTAQASEGWHLARLVQPSNVSVLAGVELWQKSSVRPDPCSTPFRLRTARGIAGRIGPDA